jgi:hypothetical protein
MWSKNQWAKQTMHVEYWPVLNTPIGIPTRLTGRRPKNRVSIAVWAKKFLNLSPGFGKRTSQPPLLWVPAAGGSGWGVRLNTHLHLAPRTRSCAVVLPLRHTSSWRAQRQLYLQNFRTHRNKLHRIAPTLTGTLLKQPISMTDNFTISVVH